MLTYQEFYQSVALPSWAPPSWLFGVAWSIIYPLFIIATVYAFILMRRKQLPVSVVVALGINWIANLLFTPIQLGLKPLWPASLDILVVLCSLLFVQKYAWRHSKIIFWLLMPYLLWGTFAAVLQLTITATNSGVATILPVLYTSGTMEQTSFTEAAEQGVASIGSGEGILLDVRRDDEWEAGHAVSAVHWELARLEAGEMPDIPNDHPVFVYCAAGKRAEKAKEILEQNGWEVTNIGGLSDWEAAGGQVE